MNSGGVAFGVGPVGTWVGSAGPLVTGTGENTPDDIGGILGGALLLLLTTIQMTMATTQTIVVITNHVGLAGLRSGAE